MIPRFLFCIFILVVGGVRGAIYTHLLSLNRSKSVVQYLQMYHPRREISPFFFSVGESSPIIPLPFMHLQQHPFYPSSFIPSTK